jgi:hypothetical protein
MTSRPPDFDDLITDDVSETERDRLQRVHEMLLAAGPPAEISPELETGPNLFLTPRKPPRKRPSVRRVLLLAATIGIAGFIGYSLGKSNEFPVTQTMSMRGTLAAPRAAGRLDIGEQDGQNWLMRLEASGLPATGKKEFYEVFLTKQGKIVAPCGWFVVHANHEQTVAYMTAPYNIDNAGWVITKVHVGQKGNGPVVMRTIRSEA